MTFEAPDSVTAFTVDLFWNETSAVEGFKAFQGLATAAPRELNLWLFMDETRQGIQGVYFGNSNDLNELIQPFLTRTEATISYARSMGWIEAHQHFANGDDLRQPYPNHLVCAVH